MRRLVRPLFLFALLLLFSFTATQTSVANILVWNNDNNSHFTHPETGASTNCEVGITSALDANDVDYTLSSTLPNDLSGYNIVMISLGLYCVG